MRDASAILELIYFIGVVLIAVAMVLYVTYLFVRRTTQGQPITKNFFTWLKHLVQIIMGLQ